MTNTKKHKKRGNDSQTQNIQAVFHVRKMMQTRDGLVLIRKLSVEIFMAR